MQYRKTRCRLVFQLRRRGLGWIYARSGSHIGVLAVAAGLGTDAEYALGMTVWTDGSTLCVHGAKVPAADPPDTARVVTRMLRQLGKGKQR